MENTQQSSARDRAIAKLTGNTQTAPVQNPNQVAPEEMGAIRASESPSDSGHNSISEGSQEPSKAATPPKSEESDQPLSSQYVHLARKEKAIRAKAQEFKAQEVALKAREDALKAKEAEMQQSSISKDRFAKDPLAVLVEQGYSYDQIAEMLLQSNNPAAQQANPRDAVIDELKAEVKALRDAQENTTKSFESQQTRAYEQALNQIRNETKQLISVDPQFETIKETGSIDDVVDLIKQKFETDGILMTVEDAAKAVEDYLVEEALKLAKLKKIQDRLKPAAPAQAQQPQSPAPVQQAQMKTLTNTMGSAKPMTAKQRALLAFEGKLNK